MNYASAKTTLTATGILAKAAGAAGLGLVLYDAHTAGSIEAPRTERNVKENTLQDHFLRNMSQEGPSIVGSEMKKKVFNFYLDENISSPFTSTTGYVKGFSSMLVQNAVPLGLSAAALMTRGFLSKAFGVGLLAYGGMFLFREFLGGEKTH